MKADLHSALTDVYDAVGIRIICGFLDDVYKMAAWLEQRKELEIILHKDYIAWPKPNGYRSYHLCLRIRTGEMAGTLAEIQIRTMAIDFWATLEHRLKCKQRIPCEELIRRELKRCADEIAATDISMQTIRDMLETGFCEEGGKDGHQEEETTAYVRVGESQIVYQIPSDSYEGLMAVSYDSLRHPEVLTADATDITQLDIRLEDTVYTITSEDEGDRRTYYYQEKEVEMDNLRSRLKNLNATSFTKEQPAQKMEIEMAVYLDNENFQKVVIELYRYDGNECLAVVDGKPVSFVPRSDVVDLIETVYEIVLN